MQKKFSSQELTDYCVDHGIKITHTTPYYPCANGEVERQNRSILKVLKISKQQGTDWRDALREYLYMYSLTTHSVTGVPPSQLMFGRRFRDLIPHLQSDFCEDEEMRDRDRIVKHQAKEIRDKRVGAKESLVAVGDEVLMKNMTPQNKLSSRFLATPARIVERYGNSLTLQTAEGQHYKRNTSHVRPLIRPSSVEKRPEEQRQLSPNAMELEQTKDSPTASAETLSRPHRDAIRPKRYDDYCLD